MRARLIFAFAVALLIAAPTTLFAQSCTPQQIVACARKLTNNLCTVYTCEPRRAGGVGPAYRCVLVNKPDGSACSNVQGCLPVGSCFGGTCSGRTYACQPKPGQPATTLCMCTAFNCQAVNAQTFKPLNASQVCTAQPPHPPVWLPE